MLVWIKRLVLLAIVAGVALPAMAAIGKTSHRHSGSLSGTWSGYITGMPGSGVKRYHISIVVNGAQTGGSWQVSARCQGPLTLESISNGYHHYLRKLAPGATCASGHVDCLERASANVFDAVTSNGVYNSSGTLSRVST